MDSSTEEPEGTTGPPHVLLTETSVSAAAFVDINAEDSRRSGATLTAKQVVRVGVAKRIHLVLNLWLQAGRLHAPLLSFGSITFSERAHCWLAWL